MYQKDNQKKKKKKDKAEGELQVERERRCETIILEYVKMNGLESSVRLMGSIGLSFEIYIH